MTSLAHLFLLTYLCSVEGSFDLKANLEVKKVEQVVENYFDIQIANFLHRAQFSMENGDFKLAENYLVDALALDPQNKQAKQLRQINSQALQRIKRLQKRKHDREFFRSNPLAASERLAFSDDDAGGVARQQLMSSEEKVPFWAQKIFLKIDEEITGLLDRPGQASLEQLSELFDVKIEASPQLRQTTDFQEPLNLRLEKISGREILDFLSNQWKAYWILHNEKIVFILKAEAPKPIVDPMHAEDYRPPDFNTLDLAGFGLSGAFVFGIQEIDQKKASSGNNLIGVLVPIDAQGANQALVKPQTITGKKD